jgi:hypothetical protein
MIVASQIQIAVELVDCEGAQDVLDLCAPGSFDVTSPDRTLWADDTDPFTASFAVAQGKVEQGDYAAIAAMAQAAGIYHLAIGQWHAEYEGGPQTLLSAGQEGTLWEALGLRTVADPEEE